MVTREQAIYCRNFEHKTCKCADGTPFRARANGACKLWKRDPSRFRLPMKHGLRFCFYIEPGNAGDWIAVDPERAVHGVLASAVGLPFETPQGIVLDAAKERGIVPMEECVTTTDLDTFVRAYAECALWSSTGEDDGPLDATYSIDDVAPSTLVAMREDCSAFLDAHRDLIGERFVRAGHDFWLTRNRHGAGFWDGDWPEPGAKILTDAAHACGSVDLYIGDDGKIYA